jgi:nicotinate dehydrogenase subunit B
VVQWTAVPDEDLRAIAHYIASLQPPPPAASSTGVETDRARAVVEEAAQRAASQQQPHAAARLFNGACGACHHDGDGPATFGPNVPLALNSNLHSDRPDNLLNVIVHGVPEPTPRATGPMPAFGQALDDAQLVELATWMRQRFAPGRPPWTQLREAVARVRAGG